MAVCTCMHVCFLFMCVYTSVWVHVCVRVVRYSRTESPSNLESLILEELLVRLNGLSSELLKCCNTDLLKYIHDLLLCGRRKRYLHKGNC